MSLRDYFKVGSRDAVLLADQLKSYSATTSTAANAAASMQNTQAQQNAFTAGIMGQQLGAYVGVGVLSQSTIANHGLSNTMTGTIKPQQHHFTQLREEDLGHPAFETPIETLINLWLARFGDLWVDKTEVVGDKFFEIAAQRLLQVGRMEEYSVTHTQNPIERVFKVVLRILG